MSKLLVNLVLLKTRLIVNTYTVATLPVYYLIQKPWKTLAEHKRLRTKTFTTNKGELVWSRNETPVSHRFLQYKSYAEIFNNLANDYDINREVLGQREVLESTVERDENGNVIQIDGKVLRKFILSDSYKWLTLKEVMQRVDNIAKGLVDSGIKKGDKVIIWADTRLEWTLCSLALMKVNATLTTLFSNLGLSGLIYGINQTQAKTIITTFDLLPKLQSFLNEVPNIKSIIYIKNRNDVFSNTFPDTTSVQSLEELESLGSQTKHAINFQLPENTNETTVIMYTSGTTGNPKAVCISHKQLMACIRVLLSNTKDLSEEANRHLYMSYLPLAHILGFTFEMFLLFGGVRIGYSSPFTITDSSPGLAKGQKSDAKLLQPTSMTSVPLVLDRILKEIYEKLNSRTPFSAPLFTYLMEYKIRWKGRGYDTPIVNKLFCSKISEAVGGKLEYIMVGGAPLNPRTQAIIKAALNVKQITQGYGATETCGGVIAMHLDDLSHGQIGIPLEGVNVKLVDWSDGGYLTSDKPNPRGELLIGSDIVALGYYKLPELTAESFETDKEGIRWFHTGDIGEVYPDGSFKIIDRKKDLTKLSNGEYISLGKIEAALKSCKLVENICVFAETERNLLYALVTPNYKSLLKLSKHLQKPENYSREQLCNDPDICAQVYDCVLESARLNGLHRIETPVKIKLCSEEWTADNNLITAAFKLKRNVVLNYYEKQIKQLIQT